MDENKLYNSIPRAPKNHYGYDAFIPDNYPKDISKYRIIKKTNYRSVEDLGGYQPSSIFYDVQLNIGWFIFNKWINVGPIDWTSIEEAQDWIRLTVQPKPISVENVVWTGK